MRPADTAALFRKAVEQHLRGRLADALHSYDAVIRSKPDFAAAHCNRGIVLQALNRLEDAVQSYDRTINLQPGHADANYNKGTALKALNRREEAVECYDQAVKFNPGHFEAYSNRGMLLRDLGRTTEALRSLERAIALKPHSAQAHCSRGHVLQDLARPLEALRSYDRAIAIDPSLIEAHFNRGHLLRAHGRLHDALQGYDRVISVKPDCAEAHSAKAAVLLELKRAVEALARCDQAIAFNADLAEAYYVRGNALNELKRPEDALGSFDRALELKPNFAEAHNNRGTALLLLQRPQEALHSFERAIEIKPDVAEAHNNRGEALRCLKRPGEALRSFDRAIEIRPDFADAFLNKGYCALTMGNFEEWWQLYEWRKKKAEFPVYSQPEWLGNESLKGKTLFIHAEQGLGDTIQFCRYAILARERGARVVLAVQDSLVRLLKDLDPAVAIVGKTAAVPAFDYHVPLLSMPLAFQTNPGNCPNSIPYLRAEGDRVDKWRRRLGSKGFRIGVCWQGSKETDIDFGRSPPLRCFAGLAKLPNLRLISLQKNGGVEQLLDLPVGMNVETLGDDFDTGPDAFIDTAAVMGSLALVIASDTAVAHLSGALGIPTWVVLKHAPDWRWLFDDSDISPWYPTMRLFRQTTSGDWSEVFAAVEARLVERIAKVERAQ
ncbi:MAG TPA: tetratricopeptide repeat protein [Rhizomicrobium sp.]|nr:tetratricopeptide repeat protein [Rhizomicrobium sp.]